MTWDKQSTSASKCQAILDPTGFLLRVEPVIHSGHGSLAGLGDAASSPCFHTGHSLRVLGARPSQGRVCACVTDTRVLGQAEAGGGGCESRTEIAAHPQKLIQYSMSPSGGVWVARDAEPGAEEERTTGGVAA